jgi:hypothetical protein
MNRKLLSTIVAVGFFAVLFGSCASKPFTVENMRSNTLSAKTVFLEINMLPWSRVYIPLIDAGIYNAGLNKIEEEYNRYQDEAIVKMLNELSNFYESLYSTEIVYDTYLLEGKNIKLNYFSNPSIETRQKIADISARHEAEYVFAIIGQMSTNGVGTFGIVGHNQLTFHTALFDKSGELVSKGIARSDVVTCKSSEIDRFISLFKLTTETSFKTLIRAMGM